MLLELWSSKEILILASLHFKFVSYGSYVYFLNEYVQFKHSDTIDTRWAADTVTCVLPHNSITLLVQSSHRAKKPASPILDATESWASSFLLRSAMLSSILHFHYFGLYGILPWILLLYLNPSSLCKLSAFWRQRIKLVNLYITVRF